MGAYLYIMLSRTDTGMGRLIRRFTAGEYNHVSLGLDDDLGHFVSFARYRQDVPLAGGYVTEPACRLLSAGEKLPVRIFRLPVEPQDVQVLEQIFSLAGNPEAGLIYNSLGALLKPLHLPCPVPGAYTCLDFAGAVLGVSFPDLAALEAAVEPWEVFRGDYHDIAPKDEENNAYFLERGFFRGTADTAAHFGRLLLRVLRLNRPADPIAGCRLDILKKSCRHQTI